MSILATITYLNTVVTGTQTNGDVYILLTDATTGLPVNGGGIFVDVTLDINGTIVPNNFSIVGQQLKIYSGLLRDTSSGYFTIFTVNGISPSGPPAPPVNICDLVINNVVINQNESSPGANDADITASATSSFLPIMYSLDNITFQTSPNFTGLSGGLKTVYVTDANPGSCTFSYSFTILILANLLVSDPSVTIGGNTSRWNAAFNPIVFKYQRKDFEVSAAAASSSNTMFTINGDMTVLVNLCAAAVIAGSNATPIYVYISAGPYQGVYLVQSATTSSVTVNVTFISTATGYLNSDDIRPYYKIITQIQYIDPVTGQAYIVNSKNRPSGAGVITTDLSSFLQSLLKATDNSTYQQINYRDINLSASYRIAYAQSWDDGTDSGFTSAYNQLPNTYYVTYTARQLGQKYGGNMAEFVPFPTSSAAKWITDFKAPAYSLTFPFDLSFIYGEVLAGLSMYYKITQLDINQNPLPNNILTSYLLNEDGSYLMNTDGSRLIISSTNLGNTPIVEHVGLNRLLIDFNFDSDVYYFKIGIYHDASTVPVQVVSDQLVRIDKDCDYNSVYLRWIGLTGSWNYYRFIFNQDVTLDVQNATIINRYVTDWENQDTIEDVIKKSAGQKIQVHAEDMTIDDIKGCQSMKYSTKVQMLVNNAPIKWQTIVVNTATYSEYNTDSPVNQFAVTFNLPGVNIQTQ